MSRREVASELASQLERAVTLLAQRLANGGALTVLTGAGVSAESGVATFRDLGGLWEHHGIEDVATPEAFERNPTLVYAFYDARRAQLASVQPNAGHHALVELEQLLGERFMLITQNVDDLHERAGSRRLLHMHGELKKARCSACETVHVWTSGLDATSVCPACQARALRPHIVWFGELPLYMDDEIPRALEASCFASIGTSGVVYPAAGFVSHARRRRALTIEVNLEPSQNAAAFDVQLTGKSGEILPRLVSLLRQKYN